MTTKSSAQTKSIPPLVIRSAIVASLGGLLFGFDGSSELSVGDRVLVGGCG